MAVDTNKLRALVIFITLVVFGIVIVGGGFQLSKQHKRINELERASRCGLPYIKDSLFEQQKRISKLEANNHMWHEECIEEQMITHNSYILGEPNREVIGIEITSDANHWNSPIILNNYTSQKSWTTFECIKWMLVRYNLQSGNEG